MDVLKSKSESSEPLLPVDAREKTASGAQSAPESRNRPTCKAAVYIRRTIVALSLLFLLLLGVSSVSPRMPCHKGRMNADWAPNNAVEAVHPVDVPAATSILQLARRDESNSTSAAVPSSSEPVPESSTAPPPESSTVVTVPSSSVAPPLSTTSVPPAPSTTESDAPPSTTSTPPRPSSTLPDTTLTTTTKTVPRPSSSTPSPSTTTPPRTSKEVVTTLTHTSPNGDVVTITSTTFVAADGGDIPAPTSATRPNPSLQDNAAGPRLGRGSLFAGVVGVAALALAV